MTIHNIFRKLSTLDELAFRLAGIPYSLLAKLIYPTPKYKSFHLVKKSGGVRIINAPRKKIKIIQRKTLELIHEHYQSVKSPVHGFVKNKSIVTNAQQHIDKSFIFNIDLEDFFPSIHFGRIKGIFLKKTI